VKHQSKFDPNRENVGKIYRDAQITGAAPIQIGDMNHEIKKSLVEDLNIAISEGYKDFQGKPFYIRVYERWDLQMKKALVRSLFKHPYRPYPEHESMVYKVIPYSNDVYFCWLLPHRTEMLNELACPELYDERQLKLYRQWENMQLEYFGFKKDDLGNWIENPLYKGDTLLSEHSDRETKVSFAKILVS